MSSRASTIQVDQAAVSPSSKAGSVHSISKEDKVSVPATDSEKVSAVNDDSNQVSQPATKVPSLASHGSDIDEKKLSLSEGADEASHNADGPESKLLTGKKLALVFGGMLASVFLIALDQTILAPAIPVIASKFNALDQIPFIISAYFLTQVAFLLLYGQVLNVFDRKWTFIWSVAHFELGSLVCGVAQDVNTLIFGRAWAGVGAAGIFVACLAIIADVTKIEDRPKLFGFFGAVFGVSSIIGPLLGGAFTDHVTWRLCFLINLPFGVITVAAILLILGPSPPPPMKDAVREYTKRKINRYLRGKYMPVESSILFRLAVLDWIGTALMLGLITLLLLPLQWGGNKYSWSSGTIIGLFVGFAAMVVVFVVWEWKLAGPTSILPLRLFKNRTQVGTALAAFFTFMSMIAGAYYIPIYFEAAKGLSATKAGLGLLPFMLGTVIAAGISGGFVSWNGRYWPILVLCPAFAAVGGGLLYTWRADTPWSKLIGYQIIFALGIGTVFQQYIIAVQVECEDPEEVSPRTAIVTMSQLIGGSIASAIATAIFGNKLAKVLPVLAPGVDVTLLRNSVEAIKTLPANLKPGAIDAYVMALNDTFLLAVGTGVGAMLSALLIRNLSVKGKDLMGGAAA